MSCQSERPVWFRDHMGWFARALSIGLACIVGLMFPTAVWAGSEIAQSPSADGAILARVSFPFFAAGREFPAGTYHVASRMPGILVIRDVTELDDVPLSVVNLRRPGNDPDRDETKMVFARVGSRYSLSEIWLPGRRGYDVGSPVTAPQVGIHDGPDPVTIADARTARLP